MTRPATDTDRRLIEAGKKALIEAGCEKLNLRQVARTARVNLGMFHYHFKTKNNFLNLILQETYEDFFKKISFASSAEKDPIEKLRLAILELGRFSRDHRKLLLSLLADALSGNRNVQQFLFRNIPRHFSLVSDLIKECQKKNLIIPSPPEHLVPIIFSCIGIPHLLHAALEKQKEKHSSFLPAAGENDFLSDQSLEIRAQMALKAIRKDHA